MALLAAIAMQAQQLVEVPAEAQVEDWTLTCNEYDQSGNATPETYDAKVATLGTDIYIQGLAFDGAWIKGTVENGLAIFDARQYVGSYANIKLYLIGYEGEGAIDMVFDYDATAGRLTTQSYILLIDGEGYTYGQMSDVTLTRKGGVTPTPDEDLVQLPDGLTPQQYVLKATSIIYESDGSVGGMEAVQWPVQVAFKGSSEVYVQGIYQYLPDAWIKGTIDDGYVTFASGQFLGRQGYPVYFCGMFLNSLTDAEFEMNGTDLSSGSYYVAINSSKTQLAPFMVLAGVSITKYVERAATPAAPTVTRYQPYVASEGYSVLMLDVPVTDVEGNALATDKLGYRLYTVTGDVQSDYVFTKDKYVNLPEPTLTVIPYDFSDGYDFYKGGSCIYVADDLSRYNRVGVQSVYTAAGETRQSEISWYQFEAGTDGVAAADKAATTVVSETLTDLQGRPASSTHHGLLIKTQRLSDGTVRTQKVMRTK